MHLLAPIRQDLDRLQLVVEGSNFSNTEELDAVQFDAITSDSRAVMAGVHSQEKVIFFARKGASRDGHEFLNELSARPEIAAFVVQEVPSGFKSRVPILQVRDSTASMAHFSKVIYGDPTATALTIAVTGTNGKTTSTFLLQSLLNIAGKRTALSGTVMLQFEDFKLASPLTTPDFSVTQKNFSVLKSKGANAFVFEASSHALDQRRLLGIELDGALFTNLTTEHLDYHRTMENYFQAKRKLFADLVRGSGKKSKWAVIPRDGSYGSRLVEEFHQANDIALWTWGHQAHSSTRHLWIREFQTSLDGSNFILECGAQSYSFSSKLIGKHNIENLCGMIAAGFAMKMDPRMIEKAISEATFIPGRLERVTHPNAPFVFVDYAHTPDALENVLSTLRGLAKGKLKVLFGCGGDRDRLKRPMMGQVAELYADEIYVSSDNPRSEDPQLIIDEILSGIQGLKKLVVDADRASAIQKVVSSSDASDVILIAGKGHETYQILGDQTIPFDDREVARRALASCA